MAVLVSRHDHALLELLWRWQRGELRVDIPVVISNHADLRESVERFGVRFEHVAIDAATHAQGEAKMLALLAGQADRSEEHTSELQSLMRISYAVFCLKKKQ